jgi:hypothetical protein
MICFVFLDGFLICFLDTESYYIAQAGLKLLDSSDPPTSASQVLALKVHS